MESFLVPGFFSNETIYFMYCRLSDLLSLLSLALFILGNYWVFTALSSTPLDGFNQNCKTTAPHLVWTVLAGVIISWLYALEVLLIVVAVVFFLPLLLVSPRARCLFHIFFRFLT